MSNWNGTIIGPGHVRTSLSTFVSNPIPLNPLTHARTHAHTHCTSSSSLSVCLSLSTTRTIENAPMKQTKNNACRARLLQTVHENRIYSLSIICGENYPDRPPTIQFISRVNLPFVSQTDGKVDPAKLPVLCNWTRSSSIETVLVEIRRSVHPHPSLLPFTYLEQYFYFCVSLFLLARWRRLIIANSHNLPRALRSSK